MMVGNHPAASAFMAEYHVPVLAQSAHSIGYKNHGLGTDVW